MMYYNEAEIIYPAHVTASLRDIRGKVWKQLVVRVLKCSEDDDHTLAFCLMMVRLDGCLTCYADSYRAMRGCGVCAQQTINRFKGSDEELVAIFEEAHRDVLHWRETGEMPFSEQLPDRIR